MHYLAPAKHLVKSQLAELEKLINSFEAENRSRVKRRQPSLTYTEVNCMLNQLVGGDVLLVWQTPNLRWDIFTGISVHETARNQRDNSNRFEGQRRVGKGGSSVKSTQECSKEQRKQHGKFL